MKCCMQERTLPISRKMLFLSTIRTMTTKNSYKKLCKNICQNCVDSQVKMSLSAQKQSGQLYKPTSTSIHFIKRSVDEN